MPRNASRSKAAAVKPKGGKGAKPGRPGGRSGTGRVTPKGSNRTTATSSGRYTPPVPKQQRVSPTWVPVLMFTLLVGGVLVVIANYLSLLPGEASNLYLFLGLGLITAGFITATRYR
ncbi:MAG TPA: cell division protein CrgA [Acidimicrobiales bacterium]|nr:cell division protein CrgA [Acidimicrobiales bacterium]